MKPPLNFAEFVAERHAIYRRRANGEPAPWTDDPILQLYRFCNVYRTLDAGTIFYLQKIASTDAPGHLHLFNSAIYRVFGSKTETWQMIGWINDWPTECAAAYDRLEEARRQGRALYGNAYVVDSSSTGGTTKLSRWYRSFYQNWNRLEDVWSLIMEDGGTLQNTTRQIAKHFAMFADFTAYEVACDLEYTCAISASDRMRWANPGPGATRGLKRVFQLSKGPSKSEAVSYMYELLVRLGSKWLHSPPLAMREIEHSLCEYEKYRKMYDHHAGFDWAKRRPKMRSFPKGLGEE